MDNHRRWTFWLGTAAACALVTVSLIALQPRVAVAQGAFELKITNCTRNDPNHESMKLMKREFDNRSNGRLKVRLFPSCQLGFTQRAIEGMQLGTIEMHSTVPAFAAGLNPGFQVPDAPGLITDLRHAARTYSYPKFRDVFVNLVQDKGLSITAIWPHSPTTYVSHTPLRRLEDFRGKKIRVIATKTEVALMASLGATGVPIDFAELLPALQRKTIDAVRTSLVVTAALKYYDVVKYATIVKDAYIPVAMFVSNKFLAKLPRDLRDLVFQVGRDVEAMMPAVSESFGSRAEKLWEANGGEVIRLSSEDQAEFMRRAQKVVQENLANNPATKKVFDLFKQAADATR